MNPDQITVPAPAPEPPAERRARSLWRNMLFLLLLLLFLPLGRPASRAEQGEAELQWRLMMARLGARIAGISLEYPEFASMTRDFAQQALDQYLLALELRPGDRKVRAAAAIMYGYLNRQPEAADLITVALRQHPGDRALYLMLLYYVGEQPRPGWAADPDLRRLLSGVTPAPIFRAGLYEGIGMLPLADKAREQAAEVAVATTLRVGAVLAIYLAGFLAALVLVILALAGRRWWGTGRLPLLPWGPAAGVQVVIALLVLQVALSLAAAGIHPRGTLGQVVLAEAIYLLAALGGLVALASLGLGLREILVAAGWRAPGWAKQAWRGLGGLAVALPVVAVAALANRFLLPEQPPSSPIIVLLARMHNPWALGLLFVLVIGIAPVVEEMVFRGILYGGLRQRWPLWPAALASGLIFALVHIQPVALLPLFVLGVALALLYERSGGSLVPPVVAHALFNCLSTLFVLTLR